MAGEKVVRTAIECRLQTGMLNWRDSRRRTAHEEVLRAMNMPPESLDSTAAD